MTPDEHQSIRGQIMAHIHSAVKGNSTKTLEWLQCLSILDAATPKAAKPKAAKPSKPTSNK
jgi:hypothetical protein